MGRAVITGGAANRRIGRGITALNLASLEDATGITLTAATTFASSDLEDYTMTLLMRAVAPTSSVDVIVELFNNDLATVVQSFVKTVKPGGVYSLMEVIFNFTVTDAAHDYSIRLNIASGGFPNYAIELAGPEVRAILKDFSVPGAGDIGGSGTTNTVPKFTAAQTLGNSRFTDDATLYGVGTTLFAREAATPGAFAAAADAVGSDFFWRGQDAGAVTAGAGLKGADYSVTTGAGSAAFAASGAAGGNGGDVVITVGTGGAGDGAGAAGREGSLSVPGAGAGSEKFGLGSLAVGVDSVALGNGASAPFAACIVIGNAAVALAANQMVVGEEDAAITDLFIGRGVTADTATELTINGTGRTGANDDGSNLALAPGIGTGAGDSGLLKLKFADTGAGAGVLNTLIESVHMRGDVTPIAFTAAGDVDGMDTFFRAQSGGTHTAADPRGGDFSFQPGALGAGGSGRAGRFTLLNQSDTPVFQAEDASLGLYGATPVVQHTTTGQTAGFVAGAGSAVLDDSTFTGGTGTAAYTIGDVVRALKLIGAMAAS